MSKIYLARDKDGRLYKYVCDNSALATEIPRKHVCDYPFDGNFYIQNKECQPEKGEEVDGRDFPEVTYENSPFLLREITEYLLPSYWACALINDDYSGLTDDEIKEIGNFLKDANGHPVDVKWETEGFYHYNDAGTLPGDCVTYVFLKDC